MDKTLERILVRGGSISWQIIKLLAKAGQATFEHIEDTFITNYNHRHRGWHDYPRRSIYNASQRLRAKGYVRTSTTGNAVVFELTEAAKKQLLAFEKLTLKHRSAMRWDKRWRLVSFDIPETQRKYRDTLRRKLKRLGLKQFQQSVWVSPYPLADDFHQIIAEGGLENRVVIIDSDRLPDEAKWKRRFGL